MGVEFPNGSGQVKKDIIVEKFFFSSLIDCEKTTDRTAKAVGL
jgi:hypothetical protein